MTEFDRNKPYNEPSPDSQLAHSNFSIVSGYNAIETYIEGAMVQVLQNELGICDPYLPEYLARIEIDGIETGALMPCHPKTGQKMHSLVRAIEVGDRVDIFRDSYRYLDFQESIGRSILFAAGRSTSPEKCFPDDSDQKLISLDFLAYGMRSFTAAAVIAADLNHLRKDILRFISDEFDLCVLALKKFQEQCG